MGADEGDAEEEAITLQELKKADLSAPRLRFQVRSAFGLLRSGCAFKAPNARKRRETTEGIAKHAAFWNCVRGPRLQCVRPGALRGRR